MVMDSGNIVQILLFAGRMGKGGFQAKVPVMPAFGIAAFRVLTPAAITGQRLHGGLRAVGVKIEGGRVLLFVQAGKPGVTIGRPAVPFCSVVQQANKNVIPKVGGRLPQGAGIHCLARITGQPANPLG